MNAIDSSTLLCDVPLMKHQLETIAFSAEKPCFFDASDAGTGKTIAHIACFAHYKLAGGEGDLLVMAPKSILKPAWGDDIEKAFPWMSYRIAEAKNREEVLSSKSDVVITNHDAMKFLSENPELLKRFSWIVIDESTAIKNPSSQRTKDAIKIVKGMTHIRCLSGTPNPNSITDLWSQYYLIDNGQRLGKSFFRFRFNTMDSIKQGFKGDFTKWVNKEGIESKVSLLVKDITIRHCTEQCLDLPENTLRMIKTQLSSKHKAQYERMRKDAVLMLEQGVITAANAAALQNKLLQLISGAAYDTEGNPCVINTDRYDLVIELIKEVQHSVVGFLFKHQKEQIVKLLDKEKIPYGVIDGSVSQQKRIETVDAFQQGKLTTILCHPKSAGHGLTLTRGKRTIWVSPTFNAEHWLQLNKRIHRNGQKHKTETIVVCAESTVEESVCKALFEKDIKIKDLLTLLQ